MRNYFKIFEVISLMLFSTAIFSAEINLPDRSPFIIAPVVEGLTVCIDAKRMVDVRKYFDASSYCGQNNFDTGAAVNQLLESIEPGGAKGKIQVGYTITLPLFSLFKNNAGKWIYDDQKIDGYLDFINKFNRPVVIYLLADHFNNQGDLSTELAKDKNNLLQFNDGSTPQSAYFGNKIIPYTLLVDEKIPVNFYRFGMLRHVVGKISKLSNSTKNNIIAVTLAGELHQMFPDFENGMGDFENLKITDFHPESVLNFKNWLKEKYKTIENFNAENEFNYLDFKSIPAPGKNIRKDKLNSFGEHYDGFAGGILPVSGWVWDKKGMIDELNLYVDSKFISQIDRGFNRLDVYRAVESIDTPNVGFRFNLNYTNLNYGRHVAQIVAKIKGINYLVKNIEFNFIDRKQSPIANKNPRRIEDFKKISDFSEIKSYVDLPKNGQDVYFNPIAKDWDIFRQTQVYDALSKYYKIVADAGIQKDKIYSHQIIPKINSTWNEELFSVNKTLHGSSSWKNGVNMYGGAANSEWLQKFIKDQKMIAYGVPEFNPQQWKNPNVHRDAIMMHYNSGAKFISPYYISITSGRKLADRKELNRMEIRTDNPVEGSDSFFNSIRDLAKY